MFNFKLGIQCTKCNRVYTMSEFKTTMVCKSCGVILRIVEGDNLRLVNGTRVSFRRKFPSMQIEVVSIEDEIQDYRKDQSK